MPQCRELTGQKWELVTANTRCTHRGQQRLYVCGLPPVALVLLRQFIGLKRWRNRPDLRIRTVTRDNRVGECIGFYIQYKFVCHGINVA